MPLIVPFGGAAPKIDPSSWVAPNATLIGSVTLDAHASVYYGSVLRADSGDEIYVGPGSNIQDNVTMHADIGHPVIVGSRVSVGHGAILHGCTVESDVLIGMGATVLNGAIVGTGSLIAAGAVVLEYTAIPPGSLVTGVPAKVARTLTEEERQGIVENARHYAELSMAHRVATGG